MVRGTIPQIRRELKKIRTRVEEKNLERIVSPTQMNPPRKCRLEALA